MLKTFLIFLFTAAFILGQDYTDNPLHKLVEGNQSFVEKSSEYSLQNFTEGQSPFAVILSCSDSRVPPEIIFNQGIGDLFVIRIAGNVSDVTATASIEYAAAVLHTPLILVLGHEHCGAVKAAIKGGDLGENLNALVAMIQPAVEKSKEEEGDLLTNAIEENVRMVKLGLRDSKIINDLEADGKLKIAGAVYSLETGIIKLVE